MIANGTMGVPPMKWPWSNHRAPIQTPLDQASSLIETLLAEHNRLTSRHNAQNKAYNTSLDQVKTKEQR